MAGGWEFPGGKLERGEAPLDGLKRELREELGVEVHDANPLIAYEHAYADRSVLLDLWLVSRFIGQPASLDGQALQWVELDRARQSRVAGSRSADDCRASRGPKTFTLALGGNDYG